MRFYIIFLTIFLYTICNIINEVDCTIITDIKKTLPSDFWPSNWWQRLKIILFNGGLWKLHENTSAGISKLLSSFNGETGSMMIVFKHDDGPRASYAYQQRFGFRGQRLVELLGTGFNSFQGNPQEPTLTFFLTPPLPSSWRTFYRNVS
ncbi:PREDICTED: uncharacterized protein LOC107071763 [Polistes dominula]|uniref:Uncharacterized protein LOC107071763 n=1 Tax=Polistes dominula TaxID=743375 RepID=A0ABM1J235_POLDO|nr:PREDICTED: uncharacterized protein LOC107071763 [Polistes dominula]